METKHVWRRSERREEKDVDCEFDALDKAAKNPSLRYGSFWADALRDLVAEGSSSEERLRARARLVEQPRRNRYEFVEPAVIPLPCFDEPPSRETASTNARSEAKETICRESRSTVSPAIKIFTFTTRLLKRRKSKRRERIATLLKKTERPAPSIEDADFQTSASRSEGKPLRFDAKSVASRKKSTSYAAHVETFLCPPRGAFARAFLRLASKKREREDYGAAERGKAKALRVLDVGKTLILAAFFFLAAVMIVALLSGD